MKQTSQASWLIATWFGLGYSRWAPGTLGTLGALPLAWGLTGLPPLAHWLSVFLVALLGVWAAQRVADDTGSLDPQFVVIDEVSGVLIALAIARGLPLYAELAAVALFRLFDITKPGPIRRLERLEPKGLGIMADDWLAGVLAGAVTLAIHAATLR